jgi:hypothetical protein
MAIILNSYRCPASIHDVLYVSSSIGSNNNKGDTPQAPLATIATAIRRADTIKLNAGDVFYEHHRIEKTVLTRYGEGNNPSLCCYKRMINPNWVQIDNNVWIINLVEENFSGVDIDGPSLSNNVGFLA